jgi:hypothetical protein
MVMYSDLSFRALVFVNPELVKKNSIRGKFANGPNIQGGEGWCS